jgi:peptidyl-prolyl cis-trans isomerase SurA
MKPAIPLLLGAAMLVCAGAPLLAQDGVKDGFRPAVAPLPAVPPGTKVNVKVEEKAKAEPVRTVSQDAPPTAEAPAPAAQDTAAAATPAPVASAATPAAATMASAAPATGATDAAVRAKPADAAAPVQEATNHPPGPGEIDATTDVHPDDTDSIAATVNDEAISEYELRQRVALYLATAGLANQKLTEEQQKRIRSQQLELLEAEKVQLQEAVKKKITVSPVEVDKRINQMMSENHFDVNQLRATLTAAGASEEALRAQLTASIAWMKTVQDEYGDQVNITPAMVDAEMQRNAEGADKTHYRVAEIFLPVDNPEQDAKVRKDAEEIEDQLHKGAPFPLVARQFSQHPTAATGGDIGWVHDGQLAPELNSAVAKMNKGDISPPIRSTGGYYILGLRDRQEALGTNVVQAPAAPTNPSGMLPLARLLFPLSPTMPKSEVDEVIKVAGHIHARYGGCEQLEQLHQKVKGTVFMNLGDTKLEDLSPQIQKALAGTKPGEAAAPFVSEAGVELIGRCDKRVIERTAYVMPTRDEVENELFQQQISAYARRYLRDLKRSANIQVRDGTKPDALIR